MPSFNTPIKREFKNHLTGDNGHIISADNLHTFSETDFEKVTSICSEDLIYNCLFKKRLKGAPYTTDNAKGFLTWAGSGWKDNEYFVFLIKDKNDQIIGAVDIKSDNIESAEIGYWISEKAPGYMTNAVIKLCEIAKEAGFRSLYGLTDPDNQKSQAVLVRAGFEDAGNIEEDGEMYRKFVKGI